MYFLEKCPDDDDDVVILKNWAFIEPLQIPGTCAKHFEFTGLSLIVDHLHPFYSRGIKML